MNTLLNDYRFEVNRGMIWAKELLRTKNSSLSKSMLDKVILTSQVEGFKSEVDLFSSLSRESRRNNIHKFVESFANLKVYSFLLSNA